jgi:hypothetical protein
MERNFCGIQYTACPDSGTLRTANPQNMRQDKLQAASSAVNTQVAAEAGILQNATQYEHVKLSL